MTSVRSPEPLSQLTADCLTDVDPLLLRPHGNRYYDDPGADPLESQHSDERNRQLAVSAAAAALNDSPVLLSTESGCVRAASVGRGGSSRQRTPTSQVVRC